MQKDDLSESSASHHDSVQHDVKKTDVESGESVSKTIPVAITPKWLVACSIYAAFMSTAFLVALLVLLPQYGKVEGSPEEQKFVQAEIDRYFKIKEEAQVKKNLEPYDKVVENQPNSKAFYGSPTARFTLVEFSDFECPYCKKFHGTPKSVVDQSNGLVNWEWVNNPLEFHNPAAQVEALAVECIRRIGGNKAYWAAIGATFNFTQGNGSGVSNINNIARYVGVDTEEFGKCLKSAKTMPVVQAHEELARAKGINSTPYSILVDNKTGQSYHIQGMQDVDAISSVVKQALQRDSAASTPQLQSSSAPE